MFIKMNQREVNMIGFYLQCYFFSWENSFVGERGFLLVKPAFFEVDCIPLDDNISWFHWWWFVFVWWSAVDFKAGDQIFKMFPTFELEKPGRGVETKESGFRWTPQRQACRRKTVSISLYDVCIKSQCCFPCLPEAASCNELFSHSICQKFVKSQ